ncbi:pantoate--beta-alanine ligase [Mucilaginibacter arboris]|uniref:Pantothenate synthetase n=1 Tax=Mucilaginibacter arboris TaxID=2682090 RepID=A0A7K1SVI8_9SPHI|nr:pantoate--beta-alanine ligase [Mucilaginibacter arboris]MVN21303.1 pantoate--beta-alanine ligase [Mucilaginibacter arboris]
MEIFKTIAALQGHLQNPDRKKPVGLVPTMGALHSGHLTLIETAKAQTATVVCSIFVNPTQFTDTTDLDKYPRPIEADIEKLKQAKCDILFMPDVQEMYPQKEYWHLDIGEIEHRLEGRFRPGHYQGVMQIVYKLFIAVKPDFAFFGQKDFQQVKVVEKMVELKSLPVKLVMCPIIREADGLAMSSRNIHLSTEERKHALVLSYALHQLKKSYVKEASAELVKEAAEMISIEPQVQLEYLEIVNANNLDNDLSDDSKGVIALVAAKVGKTRLIDNMMLS